MTIIAVIEDILLPLLRAYHRRHCERSEAIWNYVIAGNG
jgi:hypothetical protein